MGKRVKRKKYKAEKQALEDWFLNCDKACLICGKEDNDTYLLVCDTCNFRICHTFCVGLDSIPDTEWKCPECKAKEQGKTFSLTKSNLQKFREKEQKLLKVKQSEVKVGDNNKAKTKVNNNNSNTRLNKKEIKKEELNDSSDKKMILRQTKKD